MAADSGSPPRGAREASLFLLEASTRRTSSVEASMKGAKCFAETFFEGTKNTKNEPEGLGYKLKNPATYALSYFIRIGFGHVKF